MITFISFDLSSIVSTVPLSKRTALDLETSRPSPSTSLLKLSSLALDVWLLVFVWSEAKMLDGLSGVLWSSKQKCVCTSWGSHGQLVNCQTLSTSLFDPSTRGSGEPERGNV